MSSAHLLEGKASMSPRFASQNVVANSMQEGAGHAVLSAYVEIVLDNSDGRIQVHSAPCGEASADVAA